MLFTYSLSRGCEKDRCNHQVKPHEGWVWLCNVHLSDVRPREQKARELLLCHQSDQPGTALGSAAGLKDLSEGYQAEYLLVLKAAATDCDKTEEFATRLVYVW